MECPLAAGVTRPPEVAAIAAMGGGAVWKRTARERLCRSDVGASAYLPAD